MNSDEIREELAKRGISVMRKVVATDIDALNKYGYEVLSYKKKYYYYYDVSRPFTSDFTVLQRGDERRINRRDSISTQKVFSIWATGRRFNI